MLWCKNLLTCFFSMCIMSGTVYIIQYTSWMNLHGCASFSFSSFLLARLRTATLRHDDQGQVSVYLSQANTRLQISKRKTTYVYLDNRL